MTATTPPPAPKPEMRTITVPVEVLVNVDDYRDSYGQADDIEAYTAETVRWAANAQLKRVGWGTVPGVPND